MTATAVVTEARPEAREKKKSTSCKDSAEGLFPRVEVFLDWANITIAMRLLGLERRLDQVVHAAVCEFARRLDAAAIRFPSARPWLKAVRNGTYAIEPERIWCVVGKPVNVHQDDVEHVRRGHRDMMALQRRYGFIVCHVPVDHRGYHLSRDDRLKSSCALERQWQAQEKGADVDLASRLMIRACISERPFGALVLSGDFDFAPALQMVAGLRPPVIAMIAGFRDSMSGSYWRAAQLGYPSLLPPIILDQLDELGLCKGAVQDSEGHARCSRA